MFDDFATHRQADAGAFVLIYRMKPLENTEYFLCKLRVQPYTIVFNSEKPSGCSVRITCIFILRCPRLEELRVVRAVRANLNLRPLLPAKLQAVGNEVLENLCKLGRVGVHHR